MSAISFLGAMLRPGEAERLLGPAGAGSWRAIHGNSDLVLLGRGAGTELAVFESDRMAILIRGYAVLAGAPRPEPDRVAEEIRRHYQGRGDLPVDRLEGSFSLVLMDGEAGRVLLYRNLVGTGFTYYTESGGRLFFGSNLADVVETAGAALGPTGAALPALFLFRYVPGRQTLFDGVCRLMPGEIVRFDARGLARTQRQTFEDLREPRAIGPGVLDQLEETMGRVVADCAAARPRAANLLSGGVDSSLIQAYWNRAAGAAGGDRPPSVSVAVDHPRTRPDTEYATSASELLNTRHTLVAADAPYATYLVEAISNSGELPHHVQTAYFVPMARSLRQSGQSTGLCGQGADALFGLGWARTIQDADAWQWRIPLGPVRRLLATAAGLAGVEHLQMPLRLAGRLADETNPEHPINRVGVYTDWPSMWASFGSAAVADTLADRRALLARYRVLGGIQERVHACDFLTDSTDTAALWASLFEREGVDLIGPFLDSRLVRLVVNIDPRHRFPPGEPKALLKRALSRVAPGRLAHRGKLSFGQPIFEWLGPGGQLRPLAESINNYEFVGRGVRQAALARPNWFLYSLLCYDLWHKIFVDSTIARSAGRPTPVG